MNSKSINIIGGADGPTSIFITSSFDGTLVMAAGIILVLVIAGLIVWKREKKN